MRHPNSRTLWLSPISFISAQQVIQLVLLWAVHDITRSAFYELGLVARPGIRGRVIGATWGHR